MNNNYDFSNLDKSTRYSKLLIIQFQQLKAIQTINLYCNCILQLIEVLKKYIDAYDIEKAEGKQLDCLGQLIGLERFYFKNVLISDDTYRTLLKLTISYNYNVNTDYSLKKSLKDYFDNKVILLDNRDMSFDYIFNSDNEEFNALIKENDYLIPRPAGVFIRLIIKKDEDKKFFGYFNVLTKKTSEFIGGYGSVNGIDENVGYYFVESDKL